MLDGMSFSIFPPGLCLLVRWTESQIKNDRYLISLHSECMRFVVVNTDAVFLFAVGSVRKSCSFFFRKSCIFMSVSLILCGLWSFPQSGVLISPCRCCFLLSRWRKRKLDIYHQSFNLKLLRKHKPWRRETVSLLWIHSNREALRTCTENKIYMVVLSGSKTVHSTTKCNPFSKDVFRPAYLA